MQAQCRSLGDGRLHFQHGPMDIVIGADGDPDAVRQSHAAAWERFRGLLQELVAELPALRAPVSDVCPLRGEVAQTMWRAASVHRPAFVTPMVAVAGAVAQTLIQAYQRPGVTRAWANNGGDIALHLTPGASFRIGLYADIARLTRLDAAEGLAVDGVFDVAHGSPVRGVATSGWRGRSFSLGIADSVTVLAATAAQADAAASLIGNAVDVDDAGIVRVPAHHLKDDTDLGAIPVTVDVPMLGRQQVALALRAGMAHALGLREAGHIHACAITCQGWMVTTERPDQAPVFLESAAPNSAGHANNATLALCAQE
ncbi:MAG: UPF0280 family protein [Hydrogenophaga sp.]|nr:UPF0280 family protein [Hydrogenophaga sp.]